jgi:hypothetical protein
MAIENTYKLIRFTDERGPRTVSWRAGQEEYRVTIRSRNQPSGIRLRTYPGHLTIQQVREKLLAGDVDTLAEGTVLAIYGWRPPYQDLRCYLVKTRKGWVVTSRWHKNWKDMQGWIMPASRRAKIERAARKAREKRKALEPRFDRQDEIPDPYNHLPKD